MNIYYKLFNIKTAIMEAKSKLLEIDMKVYDLAEDINWHIYSHEISPSNRDYFISKVDEIAAIHIEIGLFQETMLENVRKIQKAQEVLLSEFDWDDI